MDNLRGAHCTAHFLLVLYRTISPVADTTSHSYYTDMFLPVWSSIPCAYPLMTCRRGLDVLSFHVLEGSLFIPNDTDTKRDIYVYPRGIGRPNMMSDRAMNGPSRLKSKLIKFPLRLHETLLAISLSNNPKFQRHRRSESTSCIRHPTTEVEHLKGSIVLCLFL